jgi:hypothetical protein
MTEGWTSMSKCRPGEGTLQVVPDLVAIAAYILLRPFVKKSAKGNWEIDDSSPMFQGAEIALGQELTEEDHPHTTRNS